eukprot:CFRG2112T1
MTTTKSQRDAQSHEQHVQTDCISNTDALNQLLIKNVTDTVKNQAGSVAVATAVMLIGATMFLCRRRAKLLYL